MHKLILKTVTGIAAVGLLVATMTPTVFADETIQGNGALSHNGIIVIDVSKCKVKQSSNTVALTNVASAVNSGGNTASGNTGGDVSVDTGKAVSQTDVSVQGGDNTISGDPCCDCAQPPSGNAEIKNNGAGSGNLIVDLNISKKKVKQTNNTVALTGVTQAANSGGNTTNGNTNGTTSVKTGKAKVKTNVAVNGGGNSL